MRYSKTSSDAELRQACKAGDRRACALLYERYFGKLLGISMRYTPDRETAVNVLNQAFLRIFESLDQYQERGSFQGWMSTIVFRNTMNHLRSEKRFQSPLTNIDKIAPPAVDSKVEAALAAEDIFTYVQALPEPLRTVFSLYSIDGYNHREIGEMLNISADLSRWRLKKAKSKLRKQLAPFYDQNGLTA